MNGMIVALLLAGSATASALPPRQEEPVHPSEVIFIGGKPHRDIGRGALETLRTRRQNGQTLYYRMVRYDPEFGYIAEPLPKPQPVDRVERSWGLSTDTQHYVMPYNQVIQTRIAGLFEGWAGATEFRMENGQVWKQIDGRASQAHTRSPRVYLFRQSYDYEMRVEGMQGSIRVRRER